MSEPSSATNACPKCGAVLPVASTAGLCPRCLMAEAMAPTKPDAEPVASRKALSPLELAPHFPQLEILEYLGRGGMGVVYKARQKNLDRLVALKLLAPERVGDPQFAERFAHEARALAMLNHANIVTVYDFGQAGGFYYLLMEFVDGVNLRQAMKAERFTPEQALAIVPPVCEALQYAHEHGIVHRDVKPENLLLDKDGRVKIADFGIAKMLGRSTDISVCESNDARAGVPTSRSEPGGTPAYMAPEQKAHRVTDHRADIYSLGVVLYELLTGELPGKPIEPPSRKVQIDVRLDEVVLRALEKEPERRYQQISEVKTRVETITASQPTQSAGGAAGAAATPPRQRAPLVFAAFAAVAFALAGLLWWSPWRTDKQNESYLPLNIEKDYAFTDTSRPYVLNGTYAVKENIRHAIEIKVAPGVEIRGGDIYLNKDGEFAIEGTPEKPAVLRGVTIRQNLNPHGLKAKWAVFDRCQFEKRGAWFSYYSSKWVADSCLFYKSAFPSLKGTDFGIQFTHCAFVSMRFPEIAHRRLKDKPFDHMKLLRSKWNTISSCQFVDCAVPPTVMWCAEGSNFMGCTFISGESFESEVPTDTVAYVADTLGTPPHETWRVFPASHAPLNVSYAKKPYETVTFHTISEPSGSSLPELSADKKLCGWLSSKTVVSNQGSGKQTFTLEALATLPENDAAWSRAVNLMPLIDPVKDAVKGAWTFQGDSLVSGSGKHERLMIPYEPPEEYDFRIVFIRTSGNDCIAQYVTHVGRAALWQMAGDHNKVFGFEHINGQDSQHNATTVKRQDFLKNGQIYTSLLRVRKNGVKAYLNNELISIWNTDFKDGTLHPHWDIPDHNCLGVGSFLSRVVFQEIQLLEITSKGRVVPHLGIAEAGRETAETQLQKRLTSGLDDAEMAAPAFAQKPTSTMLKLPASLGSGIGAAFLEIPQPQLFLVGFKVSFGEEKNQRVVKSLQPIYRAGMKKFLGAVQGEVQEPTQTVEAKPGYAVGGLNGMGIVFLNGFEIEFMKIQGAGGGLDTHDGYKSGWLGGKNSVGDTIKLAGMGKPIVGVFGRSDTVVRSLGLVDDGSIFEPGSADAHLTSAAAWPGSVQLLPLIDPIKDAVLGRWRMRDEALVCADDVQAARLQIPYEPPEEYDFRIVFTRTEGEEPVGQLFSQDERPALWVMGHWCNSCFGFEMVKGRTANNNPLTVWTPHSLANNRVYSSVLQVRKNGVRAFLDGRLMNEWKTDFSDASRQRLWKLPNERALGLVSDRAETVFHSIDVNEVTGKGRILRHPDIAKASREPDIRKAQRTLTVNLGGGVTMAFVLIPGGSFMMGDGNEKHRVVLTQPFYMGKYEVTREQWLAVLGGNPHPTKDPRNPVENVRWDDCQPFLATLSEKVPGMKALLPTEAQWEYTCRAGSTTKYSFGDDETRLGMYAWYESNSGNRPHPVGLKEPNAWGLYDMHGNVWEWCRDWYEPHLSNVPVDPQGPVSGTGHVLRGGAFMRDPAFLTSSCRGNGGAPPNRIGNRGLRVVLMNADDAAVRVEDKDTLTDWQARAATVKVGMTRAEVEKILPRWIPPASNSYDFCGSGWGDFYSMTEQYFVSADWRVIVTYDVSKREKFGIPNNQERVLAPVKVNKVMRSPEDKKLWMAQAASIKAGMTRAEAERNIPAWNSCETFGRFRGYTFDRFKDFDNHEMYLFADQWVDKYGTNYTWSLTIAYDGTGGERSLENRVTKPVSIEEPQRSPSGDPGYDVSSIPMQFRPLKSRVALRYHLNVGEGASMKDRLALAQAFPGLQEYEQRAVLGDEMWSRVRCQQFQPVLEAMLRLPDKPEQDAGHTIADDIMQRLIELGSDAARKLLLEDIRSGYPRFAFKGLASLPEQPVPELDAAFRVAALSWRGQRSCDLFKMSFVIGRYGSPALLDEVKALYSSSNGGWACTIQAALLRYLIKHDPGYGLAKLELALLLRGQPGKNNCFGDAIYEAVHGLKGQEIKVFAIKQLAADHPKIRYSASRYLIESDETDARNEVIRMVMLLPPRTVKRNGQYFDDLREQVLNLFLFRPAYTETHLPSLAEIDQLEANLSSVEKAYYQDRIAELRANLRK